MNPFNLVIGLALLIAGTVTVAAGKNPHKNSQKPLTKKPKAPITTQKPRPAPAPAPPEPPKPTEEPPNEPPD